MTVHNGKNASDWVIRTEAPTGDYRQPTENEQRLYGCGPEGA